MFFIGVLLPSFSYASFIESTIGTAVVNDATASYFNPAALMLLKNPQIISQLTLASFQTQFKGQSTLIASNLSQIGHSHSNTDYYSPSLYLGLPTKENIIFGLAFTTNSANRDAQENSILRYVQASNNIQDYDIVTSFAYKINEFFSLGMGINFSYAYFDLKPISGFPHSNIADSQSNNKSDGRGMGMNIGFLWKANPTTLLGFNYRSLTTYPLSGTSVLSANPPIMSHDYHFKQRTPARAVLSINHFLSKKFGLIATIQRIQSSITKHLHVYQISRPQGIINGNTPYYLRDTWQLTLGTHYRFSDDGILRIAATYNQSPGNPRYQLTTGDSTTIGCSLGYKINKTLTIDGSYAHNFTKNENIHISNRQFFTSGVNKGMRDSISLKLTFNV